jgi:hypothetical protein
MAPFLLVLLLASGAARAQTPATPPAPVVLDRIVARVNDDIIQSLDVRQARLLRLVGDDATSDAMVLDRLITRMLVLAEVSRYPLVEPPVADVTARRDRWAASWPPGTNLPARLIDAGMSDANLLAWFRDTARIETHENQRFGGAPASRDEMVAWLRDHASSYTRPDGSPATVDDPAVQADIRARLSAAKRDAAVAAWIDALRARARIVR